MTLDLEYQMMAGLFGVAFGVPLFILCCLNPGREFVAMRKSIRLEVQGMIDKQKEAEALRKKKRAEHKEATKLARAKRGHHFEHEDRLHDTKHRIEDMEDQWVTKKKTKRKDEKNDTLKEEKAERNYLKRFHNTKGKKHDAFTSKKNRKADHAHRTVELPHHGRHKAGATPKDKTPPKKKIKVNKGKKKTAKIHADPNARHLSKHQRQAKAKGKKMALM